MDSTYFFTAEGHRLRWILLFLLWTINILHADYVSF